MTPNMASTRGMQQSSNSSGGQRFEFVGKMLTDEHTFYRSCNEFDYGDDGGRNTFKYSYSSRHSLGADDNVG